MAYPTPERTSAYRAIGSVSDEHTAQFKNRKMGNIGMKDGRISAKLCLNLPSERLTNGRRRGITFHMTATLLFLLLITNTCLHQ